MFNEAGFVFENGVILCVKRGKRYQKRKDERKRSVTGESGKRCFIYEKKHDICRFLLHLYHFVSQTWAILIGAFFKGKVPVYLLYQYKK